MAENEAPPKKKVRTAPAKRSKNAPAKKKGGFKPEVQQPYDRVSCTDDHRIPTVGRR